SGRQEDEGRREAGPRGGPEGSRRGRGRAPVPHGRLGPGALDRVPRHARGDASARRGEGRQDRDRRGAREAGPDGDALRRETEIGKRKRGPRETAGLFLISSRAAPRAEAPSPAGTAPSAGSP